MQSLSIRLKTIADCVPTGSKVCDVGTDHGYLAIYLKSQGKAQSVIAADLNEKPLKRAEENIARAGVSGISLRRCDGLEGITENEADTVISAGMGGEVISGILERGAHIRKNVTFILQPTTSPEALRQFLCKNGFEIEKEIPVSENGKVYSVMVCRFFGESLIKDTAFYYVGLVSPDSEAGLLYIKKQKKRLSDCICALENTGNKSTFYFEYRNALEGIDKLLLQYGE